MHATKGFFTSVNSFVYFHIDGRNDCFILYGFFHGHSIWAMGVKKLLQNGNRAHPFHFGMDIYTSHPFWMRQINFLSILEGKPCKNKRVVL